MNWTALYQSIMKQWPSPELAGNRTEAVELLKAIKKKNDNYRKFLQRMTYGKPYTDGCYDTKENDKIASPLAPQNSRDE